MRSSTRRRRRCSVHTNVLFVRTLVYANIPRTHAGAAIEGSPKHLGNGVILISASSSQPPVSKPRSTAGWTTTFDTFPFYLPSHLMFIHPFWPACTQFFTSFPQFLLLCSVDPKYLKSSAVLFLQLISVASQLILGPAHSHAHPNPVWYSRCAILVCVNVKIINPHILYLNFSNQSLTFQTIQEIWLI